LFDGGLGGRGDHGRDRRAIDRRERDGVLGGVEAERHGADRWYPSGLSRLTSALRLAGHWSAITCGGARVDETTIADLVAADGGALAAQRPDGGRVCCA
jgi:hypothetical protein